MKTFRRVWKYARVYPGLCLATFGAGVLQTLAGLVFPKVTGKVVDNVLGPDKRADLLLTYVLIVVAAFLAQAVLNALRIRFNNTFEQKVIFDLRRDLYYTLQRLPLRWYDSRATGDIMTRVIDDVTAMERVLIDGVEQALIASLSILGVGIALYQTNPRLTAWMLLPMPVLFGGVIWYTLTAKGRYSEQRKAASAMNSLLLDNLQGVRQIKSYAREETELTRFSTAAQRVGETQLVIMRTWSTYSSAMAFFGTLGSAIVLYIGGRDVLAGTMTQGEVVQFLLYVAMFYEPVRSLHQINQLYQAGRASSERVAEILDAVQENYGEASGEIVRAKGAVEYRDVAFAYRPDVAALHDITLTVKPGQCVALVGPTGAGKSTLVSLLSRFYEATGGEILLDGRNVAGISLRELREQIGVVSQETFLFNGSILDNLRFGRPTATRAEIEEMARAACVHDFVSVLPEGYDTQVGERGVKLSVGEKQRISIARALLKNPPVLVLDEATASVDTATEQLIQQALQRLLAGRTSFVIAHRLSTVRHADLILVLEKGRILERGTHDELLARDGLYAKLCRVQHTDRFSETDVEAVLADLG